jgi:hypothetical protein
VKPLGKLENFIGCKLFENAAKDTIWIHHPKLINWSFINDIREYETRASPGTSIMRTQPG